MPSRTEAGNTIRISWRKKGYPRIDEFQSGDFFCQKIISITI
ncbi:Uncharacterized protein dnm_081100 [Desulfonema magnum]|uniref:Uncharacterized protein n=1 Tax=Desulfonema magnum TaxID=45655 RepID=A0A975GSG3_9BACT|nr:Uncharacterized protein dnm_081100 [Desulfonema magnum]